MGNKGVGGIGLALFSRASDNSLVSAKRHRTSPTLRRSRACGERDCHRSRALKARHREPTALPHALSLSRTRRARPPPVSHAQSTTLRAHCAPPCFVALAPAESDTVTSLTRAKCDTACPHFALTSCSVPKSVISPRGALALRKSDTAAVSLFPCAIPPAQLRFHDLIVRYRHVIALSSCEPRYRSSKQRYRWYICPKPSQSGIFFQNKLMNSRFSKFFF